MRIRVWIREGMLSSFLWLECPNFSSNFCVRHQVFLLSFSNFWLLAVIQCLKDLHRLGNKTHLPAEFGLQATSLLSPNCFYLKHSGCSKWYMNLLWNDSFSFQDYMACFLHWTFSSSHSQVCNRRKWAEWRPVFHFFHMRVGFQLEEEFRPQVKLLDYQ